MSNTTPVFEVNDNSMPNNPLGVLENWESFKEADKEYKFKKNLSAINELGYFGNIWVRSHHLNKQGDTSGDGHYHKFDHISLLTNGSVKVEVDGHPAKEFIAPTFIVIRKEHKHTFTALEDNTVYYCVFALRNVDGDIEDVYGPDVDPFSAAAITDQENAKRERLSKQKKLMDLESKTTHTN